MTRRCRDLTFAQAGCVDAQVSLYAFGRWQVAQPFPGIYLWRDPHGAVYLVDHTGTRRLGTYTAA